MINGHIVIDAHVHVPVLSTLKPAWLEWADTYCADHRWRAAYRDATPDPAALAQLLTNEGVDHALLFCEYSPAATGVQPIDDTAPIAAFAPQKFSLVANINPHLHFPPVDELDRQLDLGAVALKLHPVHGRFDPGAPELYPVYARCADLDVPVIVHTGISSFPGARTSMGSPELLLDVIDYFPNLPFVFAHGGRGWWYDTAAFLAQSKPNVWLDLAGLPPHKLPEYYQRFSLPRLAAKMIFGTDWPGVPGARRNVEALIELGWPQEILTAVLSGNATALFSRMRFDAKAAA
ncbi:putative TIM-barrel fold metal-dependent hydrolase [Mycobacteroides abscessus subsp. bolletii]|uniref:amidohydrolase family protein n=1 Tax=Mycobacteroides abscessus TaxID=36809 RepID=UPI0009A5CC45|nr:amidohydrolase family protein [Mycobacteroides abscessus]SKG71131.1 putative TIM-barrel fold metal-dependent hydrolase [Mycobacteroides abscessus subsp. bolletii]SKH11398.1 putative TIM-barrel fold metal-dependent hydrolase [Mycobacteroides abscessus subsp. bolletii]